MNYNDSDLNDFLDDDTFVQWVLTGENHVHWRQFLDAHPYETSRIAAARAVILRVRDTEAALPTDPGATDRGWKRISDELISSSSTSGSSRSFRFRWGLRAAAAVLAIGSLWIFFYLSRQVQTPDYKQRVQEAEKEAPLSERVNDGDSSSTFTLADGSTVTLGPGSRLSHPPNFTGPKRKVYLSGEAFFNIAHDASRPFLVYTKEVVTKVLGTSFRVKAFEDDNQVLVDVKTGKVAVFRQTGPVLSDSLKAGAVLTPNEEVLFSRDDKSFSKRLTETPLPLGETVGREQFDNIPATELLDLLAARYGIQLVYNASRLRNCVITTTVHGKSLFDNLDVICKTIGATYVKNETRIIIESAGCTGAPSP